jgi:hypothetical protein
VNHPFPPTSELSDLKALLYQNSTGHRRMPVQYP